MKKIILLSIIFSSVFFVFINFNTINQVNAAGLWETQEGFSGDNPIGAGTYGTSGKPIDVRKIIARAIFLILGFVGIIFTVLLVTAGFKYMTSQGEQDKVNESLSQIRNSVVGLLIIMISWGITTYVTSCMMGITSTDATWMCS